MGIGAMIAAILLLPEIWPGLGKLRATFVSYIRMIAPSMMLGFLIGGLIERYVPRQYISKALAQRKKRTILSSALLGFLMSACSHGILALSIELYKKGASTPVVVSFLLASPWANLPITIILFGFFGWKALYIVLGALFVAFTTGLLFQSLEKRGFIESNPHTVFDAPDFSIGADVKRRLRESHFSRAGLVSDLRQIFAGSVALARMTLGWILIGIGISSLAATFIPPAFFKTVMGPSPGGLLGTLGFAAVLEVCSEGTAPMAFEIFRQTGAFGNTFVFLMAGVVTDYTEIGLLWANIGRKTALWLPAAAVPQVVLLGIMANCIF